MAANALRKDWGIQSASEDATVWENAKTRETAILPKGIHPMDNQNAIEAAATSELEEQQQEETASDRVLALLRSAAGVAGATMNIWRKNEDTGTFKWCTDCTPEQFESGGFGMLRKRFGAGEFRIMMFARNPNNANRKSKVGQTVVEIEEDTGTDLKMIEETESDRFIGAVEKMMEKMDARLAALESNRPAPVDPFDQFSKMATIMQTLQGFMPKPVDPLGAVSNIVALMSGVRELRDAIEPTPVPDNPLLALAQPMLEMLSKTMTTNQPMMPPTQLQVVPPPQPIPQLQAVPQSQPKPALAPVAATPSATQSQVTPEVQAQLAQAQTALRQLHVFAKSNRDPIETAEFVFEYIPDDVVELIRANEWFNIIEGVTPEAAPLKEWYTKVRNRVIELLNEEAAFDAAEASGAQLPREEKPAA